MPTIVDKSLVTKVCVDDFAIRKRFSYGTVMVDLESHRIIDLIPSRDVGIVKEWLKQYPNIEVVSRDGAQIYSSATKESHPNAVQVSDRFHLIKGLSEAIDKYIIREFPARIEIPASKNSTKTSVPTFTIHSRKQRIEYAQAKYKAGMSIDEIAYMLNTTPTTIKKYLKSDTSLIEEKSIEREKSHQRALEQKRKEVEEARLLAKRGWSIEAIAKELHHTYDTIRRYLDPSYSFVNGHYNVRIPNKLAKYENTVIEMRAQGITYV